MLAMYVMYVMYVACNVYYVCMLSVYVCAYGM